MPSVAEVVRRYGPVSRAVRRHDARGHKKVLRDIAACRTGERGRCSTAAPTAGRRTPWADRAATGIARAVSAIRPKPGSRSRPIACCRVPTSWSPSRCRPSCARSRALISGWSTPRCSRRPARRCAPGGRSQVRRHGSAGLLRCVAHLGPDAGVSSSCPLRGPRRRAQRRRHSVAVVACRLPGAGEGAVDPVSCQVPRPAAGRGPAGAGGPVGLASGLGGALATGGRRPGVAALPGAVCLPRGHRRPSDRRRATTAG